MSDSRCDALRKELLKSYSPTEFPALDAQMRRWSGTEILSGCRILAATPVFRNTMCQYAALMAAGAEVTAGFGGTLPFDRKTVEMLPQFGIKCIENGTLPDEKFDLVLDCGGVNAARRAGFFVELTRSGVDRYQDAAVPVIAADSSRIKTIETALGTGNGFLRAMRKLGLGDFAGRNFVLFGCGKVGYGIAEAIRSQGGVLTVIDRRGSGGELRSKQNCWHFIGTDEREAVGATVKSAWCIVSATGKKDAVSEVCPAECLKSAEGYFANMGVEDEFGENLPPERVLNGKMPLNFILDEPTLLRYIDPALALHNFAGARLLLDKNGFSPGMNPVNPEWEEEIFADTVKNSPAAGELKDFWKGL